ncbi:hypothetical protein [Faecalispora anaeroviscerum]|uniref:hypothetical protein n=1 Tax=Faecalispora anaeroviscerum TaxID=2991836 RepID=UPI0024B8FFE8|nr:hypothetical protein [Faecalispora anaeroviscerum]
MMAYLYPIIWFAAGLIMIFKLRQENKIFIFSGIYFLFLGGWWLMNLLYPDYHMFSGTMGWVLRGVTAVALAVVGVAFYREKKRTEAAQEQEKAGQAPEQDKKYGESEEQSLPQKALEGNSEPADDVPDSHGENQP